MGKQFYPYVDWRGRIYGNLTVWDLPPCPRCDGLGVQQGPDGWDVRCNPCIGTGYQPPSLSEPADELSGTSGEERNED